MTAHEAERIAWVAGAVGVLGAAIAWIVASWSFPNAWLAALFCWIAWPLGSLALLLIHALTGGKWGWAIRPQLVAGLATLPLVLPFLLPLLFVMPALYPWLRPEIQPHLSNGFYLNLPFFAARGIAYLVIWLALGGAALWAMRRDDGGIALRRIAPPGLILLGLTFTFAAIDLTLSLDPKFGSSAYGLIEGTEAALFALALAVFWALAAGPANAASIEDLGKLMLSLLILWAYLDFMQILIVWQSDLPHEAGWYVPRIAHGWQYVAAAVALLHFVLPFFLLLWRGVQRNRRWLRRIAGLLVIAGVLRAWWLVLPAAGRGIGLADLLAMLGVFGLSAGVALRAPRFGPIAAARHG